MAAAFATTATGAASTTLATSAAGATAPAVSAVRTPLALVTGASAGLGAALALQLAESGYNLVLTARRSEALEALRRAVVDRFPARRVCCVPADLSDLAALPRTIERLWEAIESLSDPRNSNNPNYSVLSSVSPRVDLLINNAGVGRVGAFLDQDEAELRSAMALNVVSPTLLNLSFGRRLSKSGGGIICTIASVGAFQPGPFFAAYYAAKAYAFSLATALDAELAGSGVRSIVVCPGPFQSEFHAAAGINTSRAHALPTADWMARRVLRAVKRGRRVTVPGFKPWLWVTLRRWLPLWLVLRLVARAQKARMKTCSHQQ